VIGGDWQKLDTTGNVPTPRYGHSAVYSASTNAMWVFGGYDNVSGACNDLYKLDVNTHIWTKITTENKPSSRFAHSSFITEKGGKELMIVFGGCNDAAEANNQLSWLNLSEISEDSVAKWQIINTNGTAEPAPRYGMSGFRYQEYLYIFGGYNKKIETVFNDLWTLDLQNFKWSKVNQKGTNPFNTKA
jgi:hypothetical protein